MIRTSVMRAENGGKGPVAGSPPHWLLNQRDGGAGGAIQWRPPEFFQAPQLSYDIAWLGQKKKNWGYGFALY